MLSACMQRNSGAIPGKCGLRLQLRRAYVVHILCNCHMYIKEDILLYTLGAIWHLRRPVTNMQK
jgi:hypothetical protein